MEITSNKLNDAVISIGCKSQKWDTQGPELTRQIEQEDSERKTEPPDREIIPFEDV